MDGTKMVYGQDMHIIWVISILHQYFHATNTFMEGHKGCNNIQSILIDSFHNIVVGGTGNTLSVCWSMTLKVVIYKNNTDMLINWNANTAYCS